MQDTEFLLKQIRELESRLNDIEKMAKTTYPHNLQHEISGGDTVRIAVRNNGTLLTSRHKYLNFGSILKATADTTNDDVDVAFAVQNANKVLAGPATGADADPTFRALVDADMLAVKASSVKHSVAVALTTGNWTLMACDTENFDTDTIHDAGANTKLTCKTAGIYLITSSISYAAHATGQRHIMLLLGGTTNIAYHNQDANSAGVTALTIATIYQLAVNDFIETRALQDSGGNLDCTVINFAMARLGHV